MGKWVPSLPQAHMIDHADAARWYDSVLALDPDRLAWHFARLRGFGGSDIGDLVAWRLNLPGFATPESLVDEKLMRVPLSPANKYMKRGVRAEPLIREHFRDEYDAEPLDDLVEAIRTARIPSLPWARGNADDGARVGPWRCLIDYKAKSYATNTAPIHYAAQLHQYDLLAYFAQHGKVPNIERHSPLSVDKFLIVYYDYPAAQSRPIEIDYDPDVMRAVIEAGSYAWEVVMGERAFEFPRSSQVDYTSKKQLEADERKRLRSLSDNWVAWKLMANSAYTRLKQVEGEINNLLSCGGTRLPSTLDAEFRAAHAYFKADVDDEIVTLMTQRAGVKIDTLKKTTTELDAHAMAERLAALGEEPIYTRTLDPEKVAKFCEERNLRLPIEEKPVLQLSRAHRHSDFIQEGRERAADVIAQAGTTMRQFVSGTGVTRNETLEFEGEGKGSGAGAVPIRPDPENAASDVNDDLPELSVPQRMIRPRR